MIDATGVMGVMQPAIEAAVQKAADQGLTLKSVTLVLQAADGYTFEYGCEIDVSGDERGASEILL